MKKKRKYFSDISPSQRNLIFPFFFSFPFRAWCKDIKYLETI